MGRVTIDAKKYLDDLDADLAEGARYAWKRYERLRQNRINGVDLADLLEPHIGSNYAQALRDGNASEISLMVVDRGLFDRVPTELFSTWRKVYDYLDQLQGVEELSMTEDQLYENYRPSAQKVIDESKVNLDTLVGHIEKATKRFKTWSGVHDVVVEPMYNEETGLTTPVTGGYVRLGDLMGFSAYLEGSKVVVMEVLEGQDSYFFQNSADESDYFGLVRELESPGSTSKPGKWLLLWTARPTRDRRHYENARTVPPGIFLTTDADRAYGIASDLGGGEIRDLWRVVINEQSLMKTLDRGRLRDYQVVGVEPAPVKSMELVAEGERRLANKVAGWWAITPGNPGISPPPVDKGGLLNAFPGVDPADEAMYNGDGPADIMGDALGRIITEYNLVWGRPPHPEEMRAVFEFCFGPYGRDPGYAAKRSQWLVDFCNAMGTTPKQLGQSYPSHKLLDGVRRLWIERENDELIQSQMAQRVAGEYMQRVAGYYRLRRGVSVDEVIRRWSEDGDKALDDSMPQPFKPREMAPHKEYRWTRDNSRSGYAKVGGKSVWLEGPMKWDALVEDMRRNGWNPKEPLHFHIGRDGSAKVAEGNHRLAIAEKLRIPVPVEFHFHTGRVTKFPQPDVAPTVSPKAIKTVVEEVERKSMSPEEQRQVDELMDLLGI